MSLRERDGRVVWHPFTSHLYQGPKEVFVSAAGAYVTSESGRKYFDATSSWWCITHGHCHPRLVETLQRQAGRMDQVLFAPHTHAPGVELAEGLVQALGGGLERVFYSDNGSTAVEVALKLARQYWVNRGEPQRSGFLAMERGYHGDTLGAVAVSHVEEFHGHFLGAENTQRVSAPYCYRCPVQKSYPSCDIACLDSARKILERDGHRLAALVVEPLVLGAGGMIVYPKAYLEGLVALARAHGLLVIFDEVFTGFGRTGSMFAFHQLTEGPDLVCLSKGLTGGMLPLGATVVKPFVFDAFAGGADRAFQHGHTFTGNPLSTAVALESLRIFADEKVLERNRPLQGVLERWTPRFADLPRVGQVRHLGLIWAVELVQDKASKARFDPPNGPGWRAAARLWEAGIWVRPLGSQLYLVPPYCTSPEALDEVCGALYGVLSDSALYEERTP